jgi:uncharacterized protein
MENPTKHARFDFPPQLTYLLKPDQRTGSFDYPFSGPQSAKHLIESLGIPHTEISKIMVNGVIQELQYLVKDHDHLQVYAVTNDESTSPGGLSEPRFVLDGHLGRLAAYLRMLGLDCLYRNDYADPELVQISIYEGRYLLTRDRRLLMHKTIERGCLLRSLNPTEQLSEVEKRFTLKQWTRPFQRCLRCNHELIEVEKKQVLPRLQPLTIRYFDEFHLCPSCQQIYWKGSHYVRMLKMIEQIGRHNFDQDV